MYGCEIKRASKARELFFVNKQNIIIIRDKNSLEQVDRISRTVRFAVV